MTNCTDEYQKQITFCTKRRGLISAWDAEFLASVQKRLDDNKSLTPNQTTKIDEIFEKVMDKVNKNPRAA
jgi:hypothetical protein